MNSGPFLQLVCLFSLGSWLFFNGVGCVVLGPARRPWRIALSFLNSALVVAGVWLVTEDANSVVRSGALIALAMTLGAGLSSATGVRVGSALFRWVRHPQIRWGFVAALGAAVAVGAFVEFESVDEASLNQSMSDLEDVGARPSLKHAGRNRAVTDRGSQILLQEPDEPRTLDDVYPPEERLLQTPALQFQVIRHGPASNTTNCHGWVYTGGRFWVRGEDVDLILTENDYRAVDDPQPGDLAIFRNDAGVNHTGLVRYVSDGLPVLVEGKWGSCGVYLHPVGTSSYGTNFTYYRSSRQGHLLRGLVDPESPDAG